MSLRRHLLATAQRYIEAHSNLDIEGLQRIYAPSCVHRVSPTSISELFPPCNNEESVAVTTDLFKTWQTFRTQQLSDPIIDVDACKVVLFVRSTGTAEAGTYDNEYVVSLKMNPTGQLIEERLEFFDSEKLLEWLKRLGDAAQDTLGGTTNTSR